MSCRSTIVFGVNALRYMLWQVWCAHGLHVHAAPAAAFTQLGAMSPAFMRTGTTPAAFCSRTQADNRTISSDDLTIRRPSDWSWQN